MLCQSGDFSQSFIMIVLKNGIIKSYPGKDNHDESRFFRDDPEYPNRAAYDSVLVSNGKTIALGEHLERLFESVLLLDFSLGRALQKLIRDWVELVIAKAESDTQFIRITVTPNNVLVVSRPLKIDYALLEDGVSVITQRFVRDPKTIRAKRVYRPELDSFYERSENTKMNGKRCCECLIFNDHDELTEGTRSNILWVDDDGILHWCEDALSGITQKIILNLAENLGIKTEAGRLQRKQLTRIKELMTTKTSTGVWGIVRVDHIMIGKGSPGLITQQLQQAYEELILPA